MSHNHIVHELFPSSNYYCPRIHMNCQSTSSCEFVKFVGTDSWD